MKNDEIQDEIHKIALNLYEKMLPSVLEIYSEKYFPLNKTNNLEDFKNFFYLIVYQAVNLFRQQDKERITTEMHSDMKYKIETFIATRLKKELDTLLTGTSIET